MTPHEGKIYWFIHELPSKLSKERLDALNTLGVISGLLTACLFLLSDWHTVIAFFATLTIVLPALSVLLEIVSVESHKYIMKHKPYYMKSTGS